jgi:hypothetical protein
MVYVDRGGEPTIRLRSSGDGGRTWAADSDTTVFRLGAASQTREKGSMQDAWAEMGCFSLGLPATAMLAGGDALVVFYAGPQSDNTDELWERVRLG